MPLPSGGLRPTDLLGSFFLCGLAFLLLAAAAGVIQAFAPWGWGRWLALHLAFFGGVSQLVLGATQFFAGAFLATDPPPRRLVRVQLLAWNAGSTLLAVAVPLGLPAAMWVAVALLAAGLLTWAYALATIRRRSLARNPWATRWYEAAAGFFVAGILAGGMLAGGIAWRHGHLSGAHMVLNLGGWFGSAIVGTLHTFYPTLTRSPLRYPRLQPPAFRLWAAGITVLAAGYLFALTALVVAGWSALIAAAVLLLVNVIACRLRPGMRLSLAARTVGAAQIFLPAGLVLLLAGTLADGPGLALSGSSRAAAGTLLVAGWVGLTVLGSLLHLLSVPLHSRDQAGALPKSRPFADRTLVTAAVAGAAALALFQLTGAETIEPAARAVLLVAYVILAARVAALGFRVIRHARPRI